MLVVVPIRALKYIEIRVWALFLGIAAAVLLYVNVPHVLHPLGGTEPPTCEGRTMSQSEFCRVDTREAGIRRLSYEEMQQQEKDDNRDKAVIWTIVGTGAAVLALIFVVPIGSRKSAARRGKGRTSASARRAAGPPSRRGIR
ncbi:hypothetical protein [Nocardia xishanensis]|uniref:hypothetical protein n=1 Tax=Nocardia xishanensis TaxID=238964 RepID=UPI003434D124